MKRLADLVVFSDDYGRHPSSCQHLIKRFLQRNRVLWVNTIGLRRPTLSTYDVMRSMEKLLEWLRPFRSREENLWVFAPISLPWNNLGFVRSWNERVAVSQLRKVIQRLDFNQVVSLTTVPNVTDWIGQLGESLRVYYCTDDYTEWPGAEKSIILNMEEKILEKMDLFVPVSQRLLDIKNIRGKPHLLLPHGVDIEHFKKANQHVGHSKGRFSWPCIGYFGLVDERLDFDLILSLVKARPQWSWVFLGPIQTCPKELLRHPSCRFLPPVPYSVLPETVCCFDVLLLPYKNNLLIQASNPLKFRECIATGKPVVCYSMPWAMDYSDVVTLCRNFEEFLKALDDFVEGRKKLEPEKQWLKISHEPWEVRAEALANKIQNLLMKKR